MSCNKISNNEIIEKSVFSTICNRVEHIYFSEKIVNKNTNKKYNNSVYIYICI